MKKWLVKVGVLTVVFVAALVISSLVINRGTGEQVTDMGAPSIPRISFLVDGKSVNPLTGYVKDMDITAMRDTITPLEADGSLSFQVEKDGGLVSDIRYEVYSMDGKESYKESKADTSDDSGTVSVRLGDVMPGGQEAVLKIILDMQGDRSVSYYTRVIMPTDLAVSECLTFAQDFHAKALAGNAEEEIMDYLEPGPESDNTTYQTVDIHSDTTHVMWGKLKPQVLGTAEWEIKEANSVYTSILAKYEAACEDENGESGVYNIEEFFRVRYVEGTIYLLNYERDTEKVFDGTGQSFVEGGILFGIASDDIPYETDEDETLIAFVQERNLWLYDQKGKQLIKVFSFADQEGEDVRSRNDRHNVRIISIDDSGNIAFAVYGYMNRGNHEGETGAAVYYFDRAASRAEEKAFISSTKSAAIAEEELGKMIYYTPQRNMLYVLADGALYEVSLDEEEQTVLADGLAEGDYILSDDGSMAAFRTEGSEETAAGVQVLDLDSGKGYRIDAGEGETIRPLGFVNSDFVYGKAKAEDKGTDISGREITPMYEVEIRNSKNKEEAKYSFADQGIYTTDIVIEGNMLTFSRVQKSGDRYIAADQEFVTSNEERKDSTLSLGSYTTEANGKQVRLIFSEGIKDTEPEIIKAEQAVVKAPLEIGLTGDSTGDRYYVYGMGSLAAIYDRAAEAVQKAEEISGVVISSDQAYVWERGNRNLVYDTEAAAFGKEGEETSLEACERYMESYGAKKVDLTGCTLDQVLYVINKGCPVIALTSADHAVLLTGYSTTDITYVDPDTGGESTVGLSEMETMTEAGGNAFIGYIK